MNNYSCTKNHSSTPYEGELRTANGTPITDIDYHVIYEDPKWSIIETIKVLRRYYMKGKTTAEAIAETYAPWCDTNGSKLVHLGWGRTCHDGPGPAPASFFGPRCRRPLNKPLKGQCGPCNCPNELAEFYSKDSGKGVNEDLTLFDAQGQPTAALKNVLSRVLWMELGYRPRDNLINEAIAVYRP